MCRGRFSLMGTIAGANTLHGLSDDVFSFFLRNGLSGGIHFSEILPQLVSNFQLPPMRNGGRFEGADADRLTLPNAASKESFNNRLLVGREIFGVADHWVGPVYIMTDWILEVRSGFCAQ